MKFSYKFLVPISMILLTSIPSQLVSQLESEFSSNFSAFYQNGTYTNSFIQFLANGNRGTVLLFNKNFNQTVQFDSNTEDAGYMGLKDDSGANIMTLTSLEANSKNGIITIFGGPNSQRLVDVYATPDHVGSLLTSGPNSFNIYAGNLTGFTDNGYLGVLDSMDNYQAGIYVDNQDMGVVFGDIKNFVMPHPTELDKEIVYASLEGPEAAAYIRGTGKLKDGITDISFPDHFQIVGNLKDMTVQLTPLYADTYGLAVIEKNDRGFKVQELKEGTGSFKFDWEVKVVRRKFEDYQVVRKKNHRMPAQKDFDKMKLAKPMPITGIKKVKGEK